MALALALLSTSEGAWRSQRPLGRPDLVYGKKTEPVAKSSLSYVVAKILTATIMLAAIIRY